MSPFRLPRNLPPNSMEIVELACLPACLDLSTMNWILWQADFPCISPAIWSIRPLRYSLPEQVAISIDGQHPYSVVVFDVDDSVPSTLFSIPPGFLGSFGWSEVSSRNPEMHLRCSAGFSKDHVGRFCPLLFRATEDGVAWCAAETAARIGLLIRQCERQGNVTIAEILSPRASALASSYRNLVRHQTSSFFLKDFPELSGWRLFWHSIGSYQGNGMRCY